jgi:hypothetical protein
MRRKLWMRVWKYYDSEWGAWLPHKIAPWLLGKALGSKGVRVK